MADCQKHSDTLNKKVWNLLELTRTACFGKRFSSYSTAVVFRLL